MSDEVGVRACEAFVLRLCMGAGAWVIKWGDISAVACVHGKCARCLNYILGAPVPQSVARACATVCPSLCHSQWHRLCAIDCGTGARAWMCAGRARCTLVRVFEALWLLTCGFLVHVTMHATAQDTSTQGDLGPFQDMHSSSHMSPCGCAESYKVSIT